MPDSPNDPNATPRLGRSVSLEQAADMLKVSRRTIYNRIRDGRLQTVRTLGGSQRVTLESLIDLGYRPTSLSTLPARPGGPVPDSRRAFS